MSAFLREVEAVLERTPAVLDALLRGLSPAGQRADEGPGTWSPLQVVGHLIHGEETDWVTRARTILEVGEARPFAPFDRLAHLERFADVPMDALLDRFAAARAASLAALRGWSLTEAQLERRGVHPAFGPVSLRQLLATWATHDLSHLAQIARVLAKRNAEAVGPWAEYLSVLRR